MGKNLFPFFLMVLVQLGSAGTAIISKIVMDDGMNPYVHLSYRQIIATISIAPFAYFFERETRPKLTPSTLFLIFLCSIFGVTGMQTTYLIGLKNSTATITTALANLVPAITFLLAVLSGLEKVVLRSKGGQAKVMGTMLCICGAMLLSLYHGKMLIGQLKIHWKYSQHHTSKNIIHDPNNNTHGNFFLGPFLVIISCIVYSLWLIIQPRVNERYAAPYTSTTLMCFMASLECTIIALCVNNHDKNAWSLNPIRAISVLYNGIISSALAFYLITWCIKRKGPLYVSVFLPLLLVISSFLSWALLGEKLYIGTIVGSMLTVIGLYGFLWGKKKEMERIKKETEEKVFNTKKNQLTKIDLDLQLSENSKHSFTNAQSKI
ncbi:WAT1-related protein At1g09380-like precursor [Solanum lycopersicum]|uniref:WAT1-related protein n=1 Tax=Solanum lycopersicum TaxID=4081 RepID=K4B1C0_SOLLC|nr:WAT1-related protein At1g09380-like precursor [Solanum lycopersicum]CDR89232.1 EamA domain-containing protein [Solanum lycopersicum]